ncbi:uncharacterized protein LOC133343609 [Lethenteron reissneri]|uniref:uncharacterized protein LOC133343609 n=1 Tax=Lethenteron reissneri TaxID=7753 RepID=UPI002AB7B427|nr:uncharacterized protein LOC133343609 [Lethenteron reissneri]
MECHVKKTKDTTTGPPTVTASPGEGATYAITCGEWNARLIWCKFVCPGINVKCVQVKEELITPKEFVCLAGRASLKDWKRAIRLGGVMLRKVMDAGRLDFYQHDTACSSSCRSTKHEPRGLGGPGGGAATAAAAASLWPGGGRPSGWPGSFLKGDRRYVVSGCGQHQRRGVIKQRASKAGEDATALNVGGHKQQQQQQQQQQLQQLQQLQQQHQEQQQAGAAQRLAYSNGHGSLSDAVKREWSEESRRANAMGEGAGRAAGRPGHDGSLRAREAVKRSGEALVGGGGNKRGRFGVGTATAAAAMMNGQAAGMHAGEERAQKLTMAARADRADQSCSPESEQDSDLPDHVLRFWRGVARAGLLGEVVGAVQRELQARLTGLCRLAQTPALQMADAALLHGTVQSLGLSGQVDRMLAINTHGATTARRADVTTHGHGAADGVTSCEKLEGAVADTNAAASATAGRHGAAANTALATRLFTQPV